VLLIRPPFYMHKKECPTYVQEPLGLEYLASIIRNDHEVRIFDCIGEYWTNYEEVPSNPQLLHFGASWNEVKRKVRLFSPDIVGISSCFFTQATPAHYIAHIVKEVDPSIAIVIGGGHPSSYPYNVLKENKDIDIVVYGEGEETLKELVDSELQELENIAGTAYRRQDKVITNPPRSPIQNLDDVPFPSRDLVPYKNYSIMYNNTRGIPSSLRVLNQILTSIPFIDDPYLRHASDIRSRIHPSSIRLPYGTIITSRGCPFQCYFCAVQSVWGQKYRMRSAENVLDEIELLCEKYKIRHLDIHDDNFTLSKKRTIEICKGIIERNFDLTLRASSGVYLPSLDKEVLFLMKKAGFYELWFGVESGNQEILNKVIKKSLKLSQVLNIVKICRKIGIRSGGYLMVGVPGETIQTMTDTIQFAKMSGLDMVRLYVCQPYPGSCLYKDCIEKGLLTEDFIPENVKLFSDRSFIKTEDFSPTDVTRIVNEGRKILLKDGKLEQIIL